MLLRLPSMNMGMIINQAINMKDETRERDYAEYDGQELDSV